MTCTFGVPARIARCDWCRKRLSIHHPSVQIENSLFHFCRKACEEAMRREIRPEDEVK